MLQKNPYIRYSIVAIMLLGMFLLGGLVFSDIKLDQQLDILLYTCEQGASFELNGSVYFCFPAEPEAEMIDTIYHTPADLLAGNTVIA